MTAKMMLLTLIGAACVSCVSRFSFSEEQKDAAADAALLNRARALTARCLVADTHCDTAFQFENPAFRFAERHDAGHLDLPRMREGGVDVQVFAHFTSPGVSPEKALPEAREGYAALRKGLAQAGVPVVTDARAIKACWKRKQECAVFSMENGTPLVTGKIELLHEFYGLGVRAVGMCHWSANDLCDASTSEPRWNGLSPWGETLVREMNALGIMIDVSHLSDASVRRILEISTAPIFASHSDCRALNDIPRNLPDELIRAVAAKGGLFCLNYAPSFISATYARQEREREERLRPRLEALKAQCQGDRKLYWSEAGKLFDAEPIALPTVDVLIDHLDHAVKIAGIEHVGLGSDFDGIGSLPAPMKSCADIPLIAAGLLRRGYTEKDVQKILGDNFVRFFLAVEAAKKAAAKRK